MSPNTTASSSKPVFKFTVQGRASRFNTEQCAVIESRMPTWHEFALVENVKLNGRDKKLTDWKKNAAEDILLHDAFRELPANVSL